MPKLGNNKRQQNRRGRYKPYGAPRPGVGQKLAERRPFPLSASVYNPVLSVRDLPAFGLRTRRMLRYMERVTITSGASTVGAYAFSANGCYDPNVTGTGHQPTVFDMFCGSSGLYNHYTVLGSHISVIYQNANTPTTFVGLSVSGSTSVSTDFTEVIENGQLTFAVLTPAGLDGHCCTLSTKCNTAEFQGISDPLDDPDMRGDSSSNPAEQQYFILTCWNNVNATVAVVSANVIIEYDVVFHEPKKVPLS